MIPKHLKGKNAIEIFKAHKDTFIGKPYYTQDERDRTYVGQLESFVLLAIKDALMNADCAVGFGMNNSRGLEAEGRAVAFLNSIVPYTPKSLTYEEKLEKIGELIDFRICYRTTPFIGDKPLTRWYIDQCVEVKDGSILRSISGNGDTPRQAIEDHWEQLTALKTYQYLILDPGTKRECYKWNGEEWERIKENKNGNS